MLSKNTLQHKQPPGSRASLPACHRPGNPLGCRTAYQVCLYSLEEARREQQDALENPRLTFYFTDQAIGCKS